MRNHSDAQARTLKSKEQAWTNEWKNVQPSIDASLEKNSAWDASNVLPESNSPALKVAFRTIDSWLPSLVWHWDWHGWNSDGMFLSVIGTSFCSWRIRCRCGVLTFKMLGFSTHDKVPNCGLSFSYDKSVKMNHEEMCEIVDLDSNDAQTWHCVQIHGGLHLKLDQSPTTLLGCLLNLRLRIELTCQTIGGLHKFLKLSLHRCGYWRVSGSYLSGTGR